MRPPCIAKAIFFTRTPGRYGETVLDEDGDETVRCLDRPPELPARNFTPEPKAEEKKGESK